MRIALALLLICLTGCSGVFYFHNLPVTGSSVTTFTGLVSIVQLSNVSNNGTFISVTIVTFLQSGTSSTFTFCGNVVNQFPVNTMVQVNFNPGNPCATAQLIIRI
jgi:hypothetical protein